MGINNKIIFKIKTYSDLVKIEHSIFALPFGIAAFFIVVKNTEISYTNFINIIISMISIRVFAMTINRIIDKQIDLQNPRTKNREIPLGIVSIKEGILISIISLIVFLGTLFTFHPICWALSPIVILVMIIYPYTKRFTWLCHFFLGLIYLIVPPAVSIALTGTFSIEMVLLGLGGLFWVTGFDILYGILDFQYDKTNNLKSIPVKFGLKNSILISRLLHLITLIFLLLMGINLELQLIYWIGFSIISILFIWEHSLVKVNDISKLNMSFFTMNGLISIVFSIFTISEILVI
ncbi:MAG: 4-hydroxybenzoate octaprenyltransferase [Chloroflexi bacterium]|nr:4-hydroxybenzoate octaprenyltransferase [Chloroflexota bacterium]|tara:strand:- start:122 stop:997 length:876 start_codon:yes stop_codon:yes gene_type:complete